MRKETKKKEKKIQDSFVTENRPSGHWPLNTFEQSRPVLKMWILARSGVTCGQAFRFADARDCKFATNHPRDGGPIV